MWFWLKKETGGRASARAQRAVAEDPRSGASASWCAEGWAGAILRAVEAHPPGSSAWMDRGRRGNAKSIKVKGKSEGISVFAFCLWAFVVATLSGCALLAPREEVQLKQATVEELTALLSQQEAAIQTMKGLFSAKVRGGIIPIASRVEGALYYRRPSAMRLSGFTAVGSGLFEFVQDDDQ